MQVKLGGKVLNIKPLYLRLLTESGHEEVFYWGLLIAKNKDSLRLPEDGQHGRYKNIWRNEETVRATENHLFPILKKGVP